MRHFTNRPGFSPALLLIAIIVAAVIGGGAWYWVKYRPQTNIDSQANIAPVSNRNTNPGVTTDTSDWQVFRNATYNYRLRFPTNWYYHPDAMSGPPPPALIFFSNVVDNTKLPYASFIVSASDAMGQTLDNWAEITSLVADGYTKTSTTLGGRPAVRLERQALASDNGATIYALKDNWVYRLVFGTTDTAIYDANEMVMEAMLKSFEFTAPLVGDFNQTGTLSLPSGGTTWYLVWEAPGNPAINRELFFDYQYVPSMCPINGVSKKCSVAIAAGEIAAGSRVTLQGLSLDNNRVMVLSMIKTE